MKVTGELDLFGEIHAIDGYFSRDHSWSQERRETSRNGPPLTWIVGVFGDDLAFHAVGYDDPSYFSREYKKLFGAPPQRDIARLRSTIVG